jgi:hypothetical protein
MGRRYRWCSRRCVGEFDDPERIQPPPSIEPAARGSRIDSRRTGERPTGFRSVASRVEQDISERIAHFARRSQHAHVVAIRENRTGSREHPVHRFREPRTDRLHAAPERVPAVGFDDQMDVIALDRVVVQSEAVSSARCGERALDLKDGAHRAERGNTVSHSERHVAGKAIDDRSARPMLDPRFRSGLASGARPTSTMPKSIEFELFCFATH